MLMFAIQTPSHRSRLAENPTTLLAPCVSFTGRAVRLTRGSRSLRTQTGKSSVPGVLLTSELGAAASRTIRRHLLRVDTPSATSMPRGQAVPSVATANPGIIRARALPTTRMTRARARGIALAAALKMVHGVAQLLSVMCLLGTALRLLAPLDRILTGPTTLASEASPLRYLK